VRRRWSKHKSDWKNGNRTCRLASHGQDVQHPQDPDLEYLTVLPIDFTRKKKDLLEKEVWWQENVGVHKCSLNKRNYVVTVSRKGKNIPALSPKEKQFFFKANM
jgi:hypothetical protein